ncbi:LETM1-domain-containing protein [Eremomyces bilateralis CBS 781.70]|uniref:LETM1-domain-containing protein n=1 Tax=Eremomyces bilateralis CBS 781.70 TaxID=1392243 RepID=A0A6G1FQX9_9PEZI|nr:LETM1-domain-containing protein [Eremomyces bilateralis CBS 781.70]KAF1808138.1 LETM1-domain-containing protein [Eremomyces bilateralis CBS 781.70]
MYTNRATSRIAPLLVRGSRISRSRRALPGAVPAIAILLPYRANSTDTHSSTKPQGNFPPPGFNSDQAKKPLSKDDQSSEKGAQNGVSSLSEPGSITKKVMEKGNVASTGSTATQKEKSGELQSMPELAAEGEKSGAKAVAEKKKDEKKITIWQKVKKEAAHYWDGTKLLGFEVRISSKLALKMAAGYELTRRESRQLQRTVQDLGRLVPFSVFLIVPFAELLLPVALKLFPNLLPSTYEGQKAKDAKATRLRATRKEVSSFLRDTLKESGLPVTPANAQKEEFTEFFRKVRTTGVAPTPSDVIKVCKVFKDDLTLDNLSRPQLVAICRYMNLNPIGPDTFLRYQVRHHMRQIKRDDKAIAYEGVDTLSVTELQLACGSRGLRTMGVSPARLREDLQMWLDLRLKYGVPSTLLVLANAFVYATGKESEITNQIDALQAVLSSIPEELFHEIELEVHTAEGAATNRQRLEVLKEQQELIEEENEQREADEGLSAKASVRDVDNIDEKDDREAAVEQAEVQQKENGTLLDDKAGESKEKDSK